MRTLLRTATLLAVLTALPAWAQTSVQNAWIRATVPQQKATGMFARITSATGGRLVAASSPVAGLVEIHEMRMDGNMMRMRAVPAVDLPAGKAVLLEPGGYHLMLLELKQPLEPGASVPVTLVVEDGSGKRANIVVNAPVRPLDAGPPGGDHGAMKH